MRSKLFYLLLFLSLAFQAYAGPYEELLKEFPAEIRTFDATKESPEIVDQFEKDWNAFIQKGKPLPRHWQKNYSWSVVLNQFLKASSAISKLVVQNDLQNIPVKVDFSGEHSIENARLYSEQRIGGNITKVLTAEKIPVVVYGGNLDTLASSLHIPQRALQVVPSPYEAWGLKKVFIPGRYYADGKPRFVMLIPPSLQYILHYAKMFKFLGIKVEKSLLNIADQKEQVERFKKSFLKARQDFKMSPDVVVLGYYNNFSQIPDPDLKFEKEIYIGEGVTVQVMADQKSNLQYLLIKSDLTIWGESSSLLIEGALALSPKAVIFMGSAGGIAPTTPLYDISIPKEFFLDGKNLEISNFLFEQLKDRVIPGAVIGGRHGHTNSPIEQTKAYVSGKISEGITSVDVEQDLIARTVLKHNQKTGQSVQFGAINLITDKPRNNTYHWEHEADLTKIDVNKKALARQRAVLSALRGVRTSGIQAIRSCKTIYNSL